MAGMSTSTSASFASQGAPNARWYNTVWRWHFYAGLFCIPFVIWLALTGTIYLWRPQIETWLDRPYDRLPVAGPAASPDAQVGAALRAVPGSSLHRYVLADHPGAAVRIIVSADGVDRRVYVDPHSLAVLKIIAEDDRPLNVVSRLHGELLAGAWGSYLVEIAACWAVVMLLTGLYLWWPRGRRGLVGILYPRLRGGRRLFWRDIHATAGIWVSVFALGLILTGLPWASAWGSYLGEVRAITGTAAGPVDWTIGGQAAPAQADPMLRPHASHGAMSMTPSPVRHGELARVIATARPLRFAKPVLLLPPNHEGGPWTVTSEAADRSARAEAEIDGASGRLIGRLDFADRHWIDRVIGYGIAVHEGALFGLANQMLGTLTALFLVMLAISGTVLWWRRRPTGMLGAPLRLSRPRFRTPLIAAIVGLGIWMPLFGLTLMLALAAERMVMRSMPASRRWLGLRDG
jgi:uncharacterized iron-regulated membrane protein